VDRGVEALILLQTENYELWKQIEVLKTQNNIENKRLRKALTVIMEESYDQGARDCAYDALYGGDEQ
jgi:hypothetical protein